MHSGCIFFPIEVKCEQPWAGFGKYDTPSVTSIVVGAWKEDLRLILISLEEFDAVMFVILDAFRFADTTLKGLFHLPQSWFYTVASQPFSKAM